MNPLAAVRGAFGLTLMVAPGATARRASGGARIDEPTLLVARVLGARHVLQAALVGRRTGALARLGVAIDLVHAATALALGATDSRHRRLAFTNAGAAAVFAAAGALESKGT